MPKALSPRRKAHVSGQDLLSVVTHSVSVIHVEASSNFQTGADSDIETTFRVDIVRGGGEIRFLGASVEMKSEAGLAKALATASILTPDDVGVDGGVSIEELSDILAGAPLAVHNLYDAAASAARVAASSLGIPVHIPFVTPDVEISVVNLDEDSNPHPTAS